MELYNVLKRQAENIQFNNIDVDNLLDTINNFDIDGQNMIYALIKYDYTLLHDDNSIPYKAKIYKDGKMKINIDDLSQSLIKILYIFAKKHTEKINDEKQKNHNI